MPGEVLQLCRSTSLLGETDGLLLPGHWSIQYRLSAGEGRGCWSESAVTGVATPACTIQGSVLESSGMHTSRHMFAELFQCSIAQIH